MKIIKAVAAIILCAVIFCGCRIERGEEKFQQAYDEIVIGETSYFDIQKKLGDGEWRPSGDKNTTLYWQNGSMMICITFDQKAKAQLKSKNW